MSILEYIVSFCLFVVLQSLFINGVKECFSEGNIFNKLGKWLDKTIKKEWIKKPLYKCCKCMASLYGAITFFPVVIYLFGFTWEEIPVFLFDIGILVYLNYFLYKRQ